MQINAKQLDDTERVFDIMFRLDNIDVAGAEKISDEIFQKQPFFLTALLGLRHDISMVELEEIIKIYLLIWEYFKRKPRAQSVKITQESFEKRLLNNAHMFMYVDKEDNERVKKEIFENDLNSIKSGALLAIILLRLNSRPILQNMNSENKGIIITGIKTFIECFEAL